MKDTKMLRKLTEGKPTLGNQLTVILTILNLKKKKMRLIIVLSHQKLTNVNHIFCSIFFSSD